jgi:hypothetical protein
MTPVNLTLAAVAALAAAGAAKKRGSMNADDVYISRGTIRIGDDETLKVRKLGKGMFTIAYVTTDLTTPRVFLEVNDDRDGDWSKAALSDIYDGDDTNVHIPKVQRVGYTANKTVLHRQQDRLRDAAVQRPAAERQQPEGVGAVQGAEEVLGAGAAAAFKTSGVLRGEQPLQWAQDHGCRGGVRRAQP